MTRRQTFVKTTQYKYKYRQKKNDHGEKRKQMNEQTSFCIHFEFYFFCYDFAEKIYRLNEREIIWEMDITRALLHYRPNFNRRISKHVGALWAEKKITNVS